MGTRGDQLRTVAPGSPVDRTARRANMISEATRWALEKKQGDARQGNQIEDLATVFVVNNSGADRAKFEIVGIDDATYDPTEPFFQTRVALNGVEPAAEHIGRFAIYQAPAASTVPAPATISGQTLVKIDMQSEGDPAADVSPGDSTKLISGSSGAAKILWVESGTGEKWALVRLGNPAEETFPATNKSGGAVEKGHVLIADTVNSGTGLMEMIQCTLPSQAPAYVVASGGDDDADITMWKPYGIRQVMVDFHPLFNTVPWWNLLGMSVGATPGGYQGTVGLAGLGVIHGDKPEELDASRWLYDVELSDQWPEIYVGWVDTLDHSCSCPSVIPAGGLVELLDMYEYQTTFAGVIDGYVFRICCPSVDRTPSIMVVKEPSVLASFVKLWGKGHVMRVLWNGSTPSPGDRLGAKSGQWEAIKDPTGPLLVHGVKGSYAWCTFAGSGGILVDVDAAGPTVGPVTIPDGKQVHTIGTSGNIIVVTTRCNNSG